MSSSETQQLSLRTNVEIRQNPPVGHPLPSYLWQIAKTNSSLLGVKPLSKASLGTKNHWVVEESITTVHHQLMDGWDIKAHDGGGKGGGHSEMEEELTNLNHLQNAYPLQKLYHFSKCITIIHSRSWSTNCRRGNFMLLTSNLTLLSSFVSMTFYIETFIHNSVDWWWNTNHIGHG